MDSPDLLVLLKICYEGSKDRGPVFQSRSVKKLERKKDWGQ